MLKHLAARRREDMSKSLLLEEDCGASSDRIRFLWAASRRPAYAAILEPMPLRLTSVSAAHPKGTRRIRPGVSSPGGSELGPLRLVRYPPAVVGACHLSRAPFVRRHLRRRAPHPEKQTVCELASSWTRDGLSVMPPRRGGDKFFMASVIPAQAGNRGQQARSL
jgi:hypothetical protein